MNAKSQRSKILQHLKSGRTITASQALRLFGCSRLAARIEELRGLYAIPFDPKIKTNRGAWVSQYRLVESK